MHLRKLVLLLGVVTLLMARGAFALGLGDIKLNSSLNQPLDAHISLLDTGNLSSDQIRVQLASQEAFDRVGLERSYFLSQLRFNVITDSAKGSYIAVTTPDAVREPYLSFIVEVRWSSGRLLREYTVLLDLPTFSEDESARTVQGSATPVRSDSDSGAAQRQSPAQTSSAQREPVQSSSGRQTRSSGRSYSGDTYAVKDSDTLWEIALQVRPSGASVQQTMLALQKANPKAFINNNINLLRKGQVLRIPADGDIRAMTTRQAISQVAEQNQAWSGSDMGAQLDASGRTGSASRSDSGVSGRVKLAGGDGTGESGQGGGAGSDDGSGLSQKLAQTKEELDRTQGENAELRSRVQDLEEQIKTMESLLEASNEQMRALEVAAQQDEQTPEQGQGETAAEQPAEPVAQEQTDASSSASSEAVAEAPAASDEEQAQDPKPEQDAQPERDTTKVVRRAPEPTLMDTVMDNILWIGLGLIAVLVGVALWLRQRGSNNEAADQNDPFVGDDFGGDDIFAEPEAETQEPEAPEQTQSEDLDLDLDLDEQSADAGESAEAETGDVVSEADIYIAYGKYDQAEEMLRKGLESDPGSMTIKTKLLEVYAESDNLSDFDALYGDVLSNGEDRDIARANQLREQFANAPAFDEQAQPSADTGASGSSDTEEELSLEDLELELNSDSPASGSDEDDTLDLSDDFDFELSDGDDDEEPEPEPQPATGEYDLDTASHGYDLEFDEGEESDSDDELLDFDLNLDDEPEPASEPAAQPEPEPASDDDFTLELDEPEPASTDDDLGDLEFSLDDESEPAPEPSVEPTDSSDEFDLDLDLDESEPSAEPASESLSETPPLLDEDLSLDELDTDDQNEAAQPDDETIPDLETLSTEETRVDEPAYSEPAPYSPPEPEPQADSDETEKAPTLDLADDDADDFDLDKAMGDLDLEALDKEMEGLDTEFGEQPESSAQPDDEPAAPEVDDDDTFEQALAGVEQPDQAPAEGTPEMDEMPTPESAGEPDDEDLDEDMDFLADSDEVATKLDLARAYIDMGDVDGAKDILSEVTEEGDDTQRGEAKALMERIEQ